MRLLLLTCVMAASFSACTTPDAVAREHPFLDRFREAMAFVPPSMNSVWLLDLRDVDWPSELSELAVNHLVVRCGRDHDSWAGWQQRQMFDGVIIEDYGAQGVPPGRLESLGELQRWGDREVRFRPSRDIGVGQKAPATWSASIDGRFLLIADTENLLRVALDRPNGEILEVARADVAVPDDAVTFVYHRFTQAALPTVSGGDQKWVAMVLMAQPARFACWGTERAPVPRDVAREFVHSRHGDVHVWTAVAEGSFAELYVERMIELMLLMGEMVFV
jgi:hypothetical protein